MKPRYPSISYFDITIDFFWSISQNPHWPCRSLTCPTVQARCASKLLLMFCWSELDANLSAGTRRDNCTAPCNRRKPHGRTVCEEFIELGLSGWEIGANAAINRCATLRSSVSAFIQRADGRSTHQNVEGRAVVCRKALLSEGFNDFTSQR